MPIFLCSHYYICKKCLSDLENSLYTGYATVVAGILFNLLTSSIVSSSSHNTILKCIKVMINIVVRQGLKQNDLDFKCNIVYM